MNVMMNDECVMIRGNTECAQKKSGARGNDVVAHQGDQGSML
jgi:hypothetical protein